MRPRLRASFAPLSAIAAAACLVLPACTLLLQSDATQCSVTADCVKRGAAFAGAVCSDGLCRAGSAADAGPWGCLGSTSAVAPAEAAVTVTMSFYDPVTPSPGRAGKPLEGVSVRGCARLDVTCTRPVVGSVTSDAQGNAPLRLPGGFDGYLEISGPTIVPALWYFAPLPQGDGQYTVGLLSEASFNQIAQTVGATIDPNAGHTFNFALDCARTYGAFGAGVSFTSDATAPATRGFYLIDGLPSTTATSTDSSGIGGFVNLKPGVLTLASNLGGQRIGSVSVLIRAGVITYSPIAPSP